MTHEIFFFKKNSSKKILLPHDHKNHEAEHIKPIEYELTHQLNNIECIKDEINVHDANKPHVAWQFIYHITTALATEYPTAIHFSIVHQALDQQEVGDIDLQSKEYKEIVIRVATLLKEHCQRLQIYLSAPDLFKQVMQQHQHENSQTITTTDIKDYSKEYPNIDLLFEQEHLFYVDDTFLKYLKTMGEHSKNISKALYQNFTAHYHFFKQTKKYPLNFWFNLSTVTDHPIFIAPAWQAITKAIWRDEVKHRKLLTEGIPTIVQTDKKRIANILSHDKYQKKSCNIIEEDRYSTSIPILKDGLILGEIPTIKIPLGGMNRILNGINKIPSTIGHQVSRYVPRTTFNQAKNGERDYRVIKRNSFKEIAHEIGIKGEQSITDMIAVFHAMSLFQFVDNKSYGNLLAIKKTISPKTKRLESIEIVAGTLLLPYRACEDFRDGESNLMIPILPDPILVGANQYHAGQFGLQMSIAEEFTNQSIHFATHGCIQITKDNWQKFSHEHKVHPIHDKIFDQWTQDGPKNSRFLDVVENDFFTLGKSFKKEADFFKKQGEYRMQQVERAKLSVKKRKKMLL